MNLTPDQLRGTKVVKLGSVWPRAISLWLILPVGVSLLLQLPQLVTTHRMVSQFVHICKQLQRINLLAKRMELQST